MKVEVSQKIFQAHLKKFPMVVVELIIKKGKKYLLIKREIEPFKGWWHLPGGFVRFGEKLHAAAKRKAREETGLKVSVKKLVGAYDESDPRGTIIGICYLCTIDGGKLRGSFQGKDLRFFGKAPPRTIKYHRQMLKDAEFT